jgi:hypothetical protein
MLPVSSPSVSIARPLKRKVPVMPAAIMTRNGLALNQKKRSYKHNCPMVVMFQASLTKGETAAFRIIATTMN